MESIKDEKITIPNSKSMKIFLDVAMMSIEMHYYTFKSQ